VLNKIGSTKPTLEQ